MNSSLVFYLVPLAFKASLGVVTPKEAIASMGVVNHKNRELYSFSHF
jgi:hypothetical protein